MIKAFDPTNLKQIRADIDAAFATLRQKHGVAFSIGNINYTPDGSKATTKLTMVAIGDASAAADPRAARLASMQADFKRAAASYGLKPEQYGTIFKYGRSSYKLVGINTRARTTPILATDVANGTIYKLPEAAVASLVTKEHADLMGFLRGKTTPTAPGMCSNESAFDAKFNPIGKCTRSATTTRKDGFGRHATMEPFCTECAELMDESRAEMEAEARANR